MNNFDYLSLSGHNLLTFLTVLNTQSVSKAAEQLEVTQSTVSHTLDKLRLAIGDPLFVRSGRSIMATEKARSLEKPVSDILGKLKSLSDQRLFDPKLEQLEFTIAANDFTRELIFPRLLNEFNSKGIKTNFNFLPSGIPTPALLRENKCQLIITPFLPDGTDIYYRQLFEDELVCFYDGNIRQPPQNIKEFENSRFIEVRFENNQTDMKAINKSNQFKLPKASVSVPNFNSVPAFLNNSDILFVAISKMKMTCLKPFSFTKLPIRSKKLAVYMCWHHRDHHDPAHKWLRNLIEQTVIFDS